MLMRGRAKFALLVAAVLLAAGGFTFVHKGRYKPPITEVEQIADVPGLPRVLILGDSISLGYTPTVRAVLRGVANVHHAPQNTKSTTFALEHLEYWIEPGPWNAIYFNFGLHDLVRNTGPERYRQNLQVIVRRLKQTGAKLVFATTTRVQDVTTDFRPAEQEIYRTVAELVMLEHGIAIDDLHSIQVQQPYNDVHFTDAGYVTLGEHVAKTIQRIIQTPAAILNSNSMYHPSVRVTPAVTLRHS